MEYHTHGGSGSVLTVESANGHLVVQIAHGDMTASRKRTTLTREQSVSLIKEMMQLMGIEVGELIGGAAERAHSMGTRSAFG